MGYMDSHSTSSVPLTLKDQAIADARWPAARALPTARHRRARGPDPARRARHDRRRHRPQARARLLEGLDRRASTPSCSGRADAAFYMRGTPVEQVQEVAADRRVDAAEVHLLLPEDPHRLGLQSARVHDGEDLHAQGRRRHDRPLVRRPRAEVRRPARGLRRGGRGGLGARRSAARRPRDDARAARRHPAPPERAVRRRRRAGHRPRGRRAARGRRLEGDAGDGRRARSRHRPLHGREWTCRPSS